MAKRFYDSHQWKKLRKAKLSSDPLCEECLAKGITEIANEVDHIIPIEEGGSATEWSNLQSLSKRCHSKKTRRENTQGKKTIITTLAFADKEVIIGGDKGKGAYKRNKK